MVTIGVDGSGTTGYKVVAQAFDSVAFLDSVRAVSARASGEVAQRLSGVIYWSGLADALKGPARRSTQSSTPTGGITRAEVGC
jgi:hypothetical protein